MQVVNWNGGKYVLFYDTMTLNTEKFAKKVNKKYPQINICDIRAINSNFGYYKTIGNVPMEIEAHLVTYTIMQGEVPKSTLQFLEENGWKDRIKTISSTGQKNWGSDLFAVAVDEVNKLYPNIEKGLKIELQGTKRDVDKIAKLILGDDM